MAASTSLVFTMQLPDNVHRVPNDRLTVQVSVPLPAASPLLQVSNSPYFGLGV